MRPRHDILENLEEIYRESYTRAREVGDATRMSDLDSGFVRDQLTLEILLDIRDLLAASPVAGTPARGVLERLETLRRVTGR